MNEEQPIEKDQIEEQSFSILAWRDSGKYHDRKGFLVGILKQPQEKPAVLEHLVELRLLCETLGLPVVGENAFTVRTFSAATYMSKGKIEELMKEVEQSGADIIVFDNEISPAQQRNLEEILNLPVIDRTEVILGVFGMRARSKEAKMQVELAQIQYTYPRLRHMWSHFSKQRGGGGGASGGGYLKGSGEKQIEIDRRLLKSRMERLRTEIGHIGDFRKTQRQKRERSQIPVFAIVGYTNAGKSTLLNALTQADVYVEDKLFATLDTTTRRFILPTKQEILLIDTVGFIRKLPHLLVASFKSTLEEAFQADFLIHLIDASHHNALEHAETTYKVLEELNVEHKPVITVLNKIDKINADDKAQYAVYQKLRLRFPRVQEISALEHKGFEDLLSEMIFVGVKKKVICLYRIPQSEYTVMTKLTKCASILEKNYEENDIIIKAEIEEEDAKLFEKWKVEA